MRAVASGKRRAVVLANGSEGEPASHKDELLMASAPHLVLDGAQLAAAAVGADQVVCGVVFHTGKARRSMLRAAAERFSAEPGGASIRVIDVPPLYVAGEERSLVNLANGGPAIPTSGPRPFERGIGGRPTLVQNVETLVHLALINRSGPEWFRQVGTDDAPGTTLVTLSGAVAAPGVYEIALGTPLPDLLRSAGVTPQGVGGVLVGGYSGTWLTPEDAQVARLDHRGMAEVGGILGCSAVAVLPEGACGLTETAAVMRWLAGQTAGQCGPCVHGLAAIAGASATLASGAKDDRLLPRLERWAGDVEGRGACRYPDGAVRLLRSALLAFEADAKGHAAGRSCPGARWPAILPCPDVGRVA
jgi:NADH:ubiquinone oxidoreductase subunit F (NADH-binding)